MFIRNWFEVAIKSWSTWLGLFVTWLGSYMGFLASDLLSEQDKLDWHVAAQLHYIPIFLLLIGTLGFPVVRGLSQKSVQAAANK